MEQIAEDEHYFVAEIEAVLDLIDEKVEIDTAEMGEQQTKVVSDSISA